MIDDSYDHYDADDFPLRYHSPWPTVIFFGLWIVLAIFGFWRAS